MPPKKAAPTSTLFVVSSSSGVQSIHASRESAGEGLAETKEAGVSGVAISTHELIGGSITITEVKKPTAKAKTAKTKVIKAQEDDDEDMKDEEAEDEPPKPKTSAVAAKKTKSAAEQLAANKDAGKGKKAGEVDLPENVQVLLKGTGTAFKGLIVVVTGVPPIIGRKNAEKLVEAYGGKLGKSMTGKTNYVVVGNDAGPKKLEHIEALGVKTMDEDELIAFLEAGGSSAKQAAFDDDEDEEEEEPEEKPVKKVAKRQKK